MQKLRHTLWFELVLLIWISCFAACGRREETSLEEAVISETPETKHTEENTEENTEPSVICVFVCGKVTSPGVYELPGGSRVEDAIRAAGGMTQEAEEFYLNQAEALTDGQKIYVPDREEAERSVQGSAVPGAADAAGAGATQNGESRININTASKEELMTLSGIGETKAQSILDYRQEHGAFQSIEEIKQVDGIKDGLFNRMKDKIII